MENAKVTLYQAKSGKVLFSVLAVSMPLNHTILNEYADKLFPDKYYSILLCR